MDDSQLVEDFDYDLPVEAIAQTPAEPRDSARMLVADSAGQVSHAKVCELERYLSPGDLLVVNDTKVIAARLLVQKPTGGAVEVFLLEPTGGVGSNTGYVQWRALIRPARRVRESMVLSSDGRELVLVDQSLAGGQWLVSIAPEALELAGQVPLPPYISTPLLDPDRYQTVYAKKSGSVAAPTAGLHFTTDLMQRLGKAGVGIESVELRVGLATFKPLSAARIADHIMHAEGYSVSEASWERVCNAKRVVAVGTTVVRALETVASGGPLCGRTELFIRRGFDWQVVDQLLTNFHMPRSSLLVLVDAFLSQGQDQNETHSWRELYSMAVQHGYRFLSFGDAMLLSGGRRR